MTLVNGRPECAKFPVCVWQLLISDNAIRVNYWAWVAQLENPTATIVDGYPELSRHPLSEWRRLVTAGETCSGYWLWASGKILAETKVTA